MGSNKPSPQVTQSVTQLPSWIEEPSKANIAEANRIAAKPYEAYGGELNAGFNQDQQAAFNMIRNNAGNLNNVYQGAMGVTAQAAGYNPNQIQAGMVGTGSIPTTNLQGYMNPYTQNVIDASVQGMNNQYKQNVNAIGDQATRSGAFGGSRHGVAEGVAASENARQVGELNANLRNQAYNNATGLYTQDQSRMLQAGMANQQADMSAQSANQQAGMNMNTQRLSAAQMAGQLAQGQQSYQQGDARALAGVGAEQRDYEQAVLNEQYNRYMEKKNYDKDNLNLRIAALSSSPYGKTVTETRSGGTSGGNPLMGALGGAMSGFAMTGNPFGALAGGVMGGLGSR